MRRRPDSVTLLGWLLVLVLALYFFLITVPGAQAGTKREEPKGELIFEMKSRELRIFVYEDVNVRCYVSVVDVSMIGLQTAISCVKKDPPTYKESLPFHVPLEGPLDGSN